MKRMILMTAVILLSFVNLAYASSCPKATPTNNPAFCATFRTAAICHCTSSGLPARMCSDMRLLYERMINVFKSVQNACEFQHDTSTQECIDSWNCYRQGGLNSNNEPCSGTGAACA